jgi:hypothetical protein
MCFLCGKSAVQSSDKRSVQTLELQQAVLQECNSRVDEWAVKVQGRLSSCVDLPAVEAIYHANCRIRFKTGLEEVSGVTKVGGQIESEKMEAFKKLCEYVDGVAENRLYTLVELHGIMKQFAMAGHGVEGGTYSEKHMLRLLKDRYGDDLTCADESGRKTVLCFKDTTKYIINEEWYRNRKEDLSSDSERIVQTAARLIATQIRAMTDNLAEYPSTADMSSASNNFVPSLLQLFLSTLITCELKQTAVGQCIVQAARPRSIIAPLLLGLGVSVHQEFRSSSLVTQLSRLGFCVSNDEVRRFHQSVMQSQLLQNVPTAATFVQYVGDNVDHNILTVPLFAWQWQH